MKVYPDEPNPFDEFKWKAFWIGKMYNPKTELLEQDRVWVHQCWLQTKRNWHMREVDPPLTAYEETENQQGLREFPHT